MSYLPVEKGERMSYIKINEEEEKCEECGRVEHPAYMCWRVGHLQKEEDKE